MKCVISPAKKMNVDVDGFPVLALPQFLEQTNRLKTILQAMEPQALQQLWGCNETIAKCNVERLQTMDLHTGLTPAIAAYEGIQYRYMAPHVLEENQLSYLQSHLRILSGFYGLLRPFDGVSPYRLEMQAKLDVDGSKHLYNFWGSALATALALETDCILNLASKEYARAMLPHLPDSVQVVTVIFGTEQSGKIVEKGTMCKMARGEMVRYLAENQVETLEEVKNFNRLEFMYSASHSTNTKMVFIKKGEIQC